MYIQIEEKPYALIGRKLYEKMGKPEFVHLSRMKGTDSFVIIPMSLEDAEQFQCSPVIRFPEKRKTPAGFYWTVPSLEYFKTVAGITLITSRVLHVKKLTINDKNYFKICSR